MAVTFIKPTWFAFDTRMIFLLFVLINDKNNKKFLICYCKRPPEKISPPSPSGLNLNLNAPIIVMFNRIIRCVSFVLDISIKGVGRKIFRG